MLSDDDSNYKTKAFAEQMLKETDVASLEYIQREEFNTLRIKKLVASVLAEFKTSNYNCGLSEEEMQDFLVLNSKVEINKKTNY